MQKYVALQVKVQKTKLKPCIESAKLDLNTYANIADNVHNNKLVIATHLIHQHSQAFHRKTRARFETSFNTKLVQPPHLPTVGNWIRCIAKVKTFESKKASHDRIDCRAPTEGARQKSATCRGLQKMIEEAQSRDQGVVSGYRCLLPLSHLEVPEQRVVFPPRRAADGGRVANLSPVSWA